jgi:D-xylose transport system substrate-binding protein
MDDSQVSHWVKDKSMFIENIEREGGEVVFAASEKDVAKQYDLAVKMLDEGIDVLVLIAADMHEAAKIVMMAHKKGVRVIAYDKLIKGCSLDFYISFDHVNAGELQAQYLSVVCPTGNYAILGGAISDNNSFLLKLGQLTVLQPLIDKGDITIVYDNYGTAWSVDEGYRLMNDCLKKNKDISAIVAANDRIAEGAIKALREAGIDEKSVCVAGMDADLEACRRIVAGAQSMTVYKPIEAIAVKAAEIAMQVAIEDEAPRMNLSINNGFKQVPALLLPTMVVSRETIDLTVVADGYLQEQKIRQE